MTEHTIHKIKISLRYIIYLNILLFMIFTIIYLKSFHISQLQFGSDILLSAACPRYIIINIYDPSFYITSFSFIISETIGSVRHPQIHARPSRRKRVRAVQLQRAAHRNPGAIVSHFRAGSRFRHPVGFRL